MKKGISPLIATVIILGLVIVIAGAIIIFGKEFIEKSTQRVDVETEERTVCMQDVRFEIIAACYLDSETLKIVVLNTGKKDIKKFHARFYESSTEVSTPTIKQVVMAGGSEPMEIKVESKETKPIKQIEMFPVVRHKFKTLVCSINIQSFGDLHSDILDTCTS